MSFKEFEWAEYKTTSKNGNVIYWATRPSVNDEEGVFIGSGKRAVGERELLNQYQIDHWPNGMLVKRIRAKDEDHFGMDLAMGVKPKKDNKYARPFTKRMIENKNFDLYDIGNAFNLHHMVAHAVKKQIAAGTRNGNKPALQDIDEAIWTLQEYRKEFLP